jgi:hypothetical protein
MTNMRMTNRGIRGLADFSKIIWEGIYRLTGPAKRTRGTIGLNWGHIGNDWEMTGNRWE